MKLLPLPHTSLSEFQTIKKIFEINGEWKFLMISFLSYLKLFLNGLLNKSRFQTFTKLDADRSALKKPQLRNENQINMTNNLNNLRWLPDAGFCQNFTPLIFAKLSIRLHTDRLHENFLNFLLPLLLICLLVHQEPAHGDVAR